MIVIVKSANSNKRAVCNVLGATTVSFLVREIILLQLPNSLEAMALIDINSEEVI